MLSLADVNSFFSILSIFRRFSIFKNVRRLYFKVDCQEFSLIFTTINKVFLLNGSSTDTLRNRLNDSLLGWPDCSINSKYVLLGNFILNYSSDYSSQVDDVYGWNEVVSLVEEVKITRILKPSCLEELVEVTFSLTVPDTCT